MCILSKQVRKFMTWTVYQNIIFPPRVHFAQMLIVFKSWFSRYISLSELIDPTQYTFTFFLDEVTLLKLAFDCTQCTSFFFSWWNAFTKIWNLVLQLDEIPWVYSYTSPTVETGYFLNLKKIQLYILMMDEHCGVVETEWNQIIFTVSHERTGISILDNYFRWLMFIVIATKI
jgi:hypothetical protein